jgi:Fe-S oxidoreductase
MWYPITGSFQILQRKEVRKVVEELEVIELDDYTLCFCCGGGGGGGIK